MTDVEVVEQYTFSAITENSPGVLHRLTSVFTRRKINVESLCVAETGIEGVSRFTIVINATDSLVRKLEGQIQKIIEVIEVHAFRGGAGLIYKELAFFRVVSAKSDDLNRAVNAALDHGALIQHHDEHYVVIEKVGLREEIGKLYALLDPLGLEEFVRSGPIAIVRYQGLFATKREEVIEIMNKRKKKTV